MKNSILLFIGLSLLIFTSCKDDDADDVVSVESQLIDTWIVSDVDFVGSIGLEINGEEFFFDFETELAESTARMILSPDGTYESTGQVNFSMDLLQEGEVVTSVPANENEPIDFSDTGTWSVNENDEIEIDGENTTFENDQLIFQSVFSDSMPDIPGFTFQFESVTIILSRE